MPVMMRTRGAPPGIRASTYQFQPRHLLYSEDPSLGWQVGQLADQTRRIRKLLPCYLHDGFRILCQ